MANELRKEPLTGVYDGVTPAELLPKGAINDGLNIRKVSKAGGWRGRKGCALLNTTAGESGAATKSLHQYTNPIQEDFHLITQINSKLLERANLTAGTSLGTTLGVAVGTTPGFSAVVKASWFYADGSGIPIVWGGNTPYPSGFFNYDTSEVALSDFLDEVTDGRTTTSALVTSASDDYFIVLTPERCSGVTLDLGDVNSNAVSLTVSAWRSGSWTGVSSLSDGTETGGDTTLAQDGAITWTASASDDLKVVGNLQGYAYKFTWSGALSGNITVLDCTTVQPATAMTNKWNGLWDWITGCRFYDQSAGEYQETLGKITNESDSQYIDLSEATTSDFLYIKTPEPATGFGFGVATGYANTADAQIDLIEVWTGVDWTDISTFDDGTLDSGADSSFSQTGRIVFDGASYTPTKRTFQGDNLAGYWYRISWDASLATDVRIFAVFYAAQPDPLRTTNGLIEFKGRLLTWEAGENRLRYSAKGGPWTFSGSDSGYTDEFGDESEIICAVKYYNELIVFKASGKGIFLLEGYSPATFGILQLSSTGGLASPQTAKAAEVGYPGMHQDEPVNIVLFQDIDGIYAIDGRKPKKVSASVEHYFDPEYSICIAAASINNRQAFVDPIKNEYHFLLPAGELVFNFLMDEWYPPWDRSIDLDCGLWLKGADGRKYNYAGSSGGFVMLLETDTADKNASNADATIQHSIKSRAFGGIEEGGISLDFVLRKLWGVFKAQAAGSITTKTYKNQASSGTAQTTPGAMTLINTGYNTSTPFVTMSIKNCSSMQIEFSTNTADLVFEVWSFIYEFELMRAIGQ